MKRDYTTRPKRIPQNVSGHESAKAILGLPVREGSTSPDCDLKNCREEGASKRWPTREQGETPSWSVSNRSRD